MGDEEVRQAKQSKEIKAMKSQVMHKKEDSKIAEAMPQAQKNVEKKHEEKQEVKTHEHHEQETSKQDKKKKERKIILEREYMVPLRREWLKVPEYKRANKAVKALKQFLVKHMKVYDRDLNKIRVDIYLNNEIRFRGMKKPPARIKVKAIKYDDGTVDAKLIQLPKHIEFEIARNVRREAERLTKKVKKKEEKVEATKEEVKETKEKEESSKLAMEKMEKQLAQKTKHTTVAKGKQQEPIIHRTALQK